MLKIFLFLITVLIVSCSASYNTPNQNEYIANLQKEQFFMHVPEILQLENYAVAVKNEKEGILKFQQSIAISDKHSVDFYIEFKFNDSTRNVHCVTKAIINKDNKTFTEYYNLECYREEYKTYFLNALEAVKNYCTKVSFRNPPGN